MGQSIGLGVTAIICTRNRCDSLKRTLASIGAQRLDGISFTLVVVDNGSSDATRRVIEAFATQAPFPVVSLFEPRPGLSLARNRGLDVATGDILLFTDDDCLVAADWALRASDCFGSTLMQVVGGRIELANPTDLEITIRTSPEPETLRSANDLLGFMHGANFAVGRPALDRIGRFDPVFGAGTWLRSAEDSDFIYRAFVLGLPVRYEPGFVVRHDHGRSGRHDRTRLERAYCTGNGALLAKDLLEGRVDLVRPIYWGCREALRAWKAHPADWRVLWPKVSLLTGFLRFMSITFWHRVLGR